MRPLREVAVGGCSTQAQLAFADVNVSSNAGAIECFFETSVFSDYMLTTASAIVVVGALTLNFNIIACCLRMRLRWVASDVLVGRAHIVCRRPDAGTACLGCCLYSQQSCAIP